MNNLGINLLFGAGSFWLILSGQIAFAEPVVNYFPKIEKIVGEKCAYCHSKGNLSFPLDTYEALYNFRLPATDAVYKRRMPPWLAAPGHQEYKGDFSLTEDELSLWRLWEKNKFAKGDPKIGEKIKSIQLPEFEPDVQIDVFTKDKVFVPNPDLNDEYRCFAVKWPKSKKTYLKAVKFETEQNSRIHHALFFVAKPKVVPFLSGAIGAIERGKSGKADRRKGYPCYGTWLPDGIIDNDRELTSNKVITNSFTYRDKLLATILSNSFMAFPWAAGSQEQHFEDNGIPIEPGSLLIAQMHISNIQNSKEPISSGSLKFKVAKHVEAPGAFVLTTNPDWLFKRQNNDLVLPPNQKTSVSNALSLKHLFETLKLYIGEGVQYRGLKIHGVGLHMHNYGVSGEIKITDESADKTTILLEVPHFDFNWQTVHMLKKPIQFNFEDFEGKNLVVDCNYFNPGSKPIYGGLGVENEMCQIYGYYSLIPSRNIQSAGLRGVFKFPITK